MSMAVKRVLMVHNYYQQGGGEHTVFENEVRLLRENGCEVTTYTKDNKDLKRKPWRLLFLPFATIWSFKTYRSVKCLIREHDIEVVHCHNTFPQISPSVYYAAWSCGVPVVQTIHNFRFVCPNGLCFRDGAVCEDCLKLGLRCSLRHRCYRDSLLQTLPVAAMLWIHRKVGTYKRLAYIFLTDAYKNYFEQREWFGKEHFVKPNTIPLLEERTDAPVINKNEFIFVGRVQREKGIAFLLEQFERHPEWTLHLFGDTERAGTKLLEKLATEANVIQHGFCEKSEMRPIWERCCAMLWPSRCRESFGMNVVESFSLGVPVLASKTANWNGLVKPGVWGAEFDFTAESFEAGVEQLQKHRAFFSESAKREIQRYSEKQNYPQMVAVYERLLRQES